MNCCCYIASCEGKHRLKVGGQEVDVHSLPFPSRHQPTFLSHDAGCKAIRNGCRFGLLCQDRFGLLSAQMPIVALLGVYHNIEGGDSKSSPKLVISVTFEADIHYFTCIGGTTLWNTHCFFLVESENEFNGNKGGTRRPIAAPKRQFPEHAIRPASSCFCLITSHPWSFRII